MIQTVGNITALVVPVWFLCMGLFVYFRNRNSAVNRAFFLYFMSLSVWSLGIFGMVTAASEKDARPWLFVLSLGLVFLPSTLLNFVNKFLGGIRSERDRAILRISMAVTAIFLVLSFTPYYAKGVSKIHYGYIIDPGPVFLLFVASAMSVIIYAHVLLVREYGKLSGYRRNQVGYLFLGTAIFIAGELLVVPSTLGMTLLDGFPVWNLTSILYAVILAYAMIKFHLMDIRLAVTRAGIFLLVYTIVLGIPFYIGLHSGFGLLTTILMGVLATTGPLLFSLLQNKAESILLAQQRHYQHILLQASTGMLKELDLDHLLKLIVYIIKKTVRIEFAAVFFNNTETGNFELRVIRDTRYVQRPFSFPASHPFVSYFLKHRKPLRCEDLPSDIRKTIPFARHVNLIIPSFIEDRLLGFLVLGNKLNGRIYSQDDFNVFVTLSNQATLAVENCIFLEEFKKAQERLFSAEKLASIGGMADGVAHQIKNRLNQFSVTAGEQRFEIDDFIRDHKALVDANPELRKSLDYLKTIADSLLDNVKKTAGIIQGILNFARVEEKSSFFSEFSLVDAIKPSRELLCIKHQLADFPLSVRVDGPDVIYGVKSQIMESIYNLLDNGYEAVCEKIRYHLGESEKRTFVPEITLQMSQKGNFSVIEITDNGIGIKKENMDKMFAPFFTTKVSSKSGSGIGLYVVKRMIEENHKGKIRFESEYMRGTKMFLEIPRPPKPADLAS